jgi:hypothetical protein
MARSVLIFLSAFLSFPTFGICPPKVDPAKSLLITSLEVIENSRARGPWSFEEIFRRAVAFHPRAEWIGYQWLDEFGKHASYNGYSLPQRTPGPLLQLWPHAVEGPNLIRMSLDKAPFKLLAIAFRIDLNGKWGEVRFVYNVADEILGTQDMNVIFEFDLKPTPEFPKAIYWYRAIAKLSTLSGDAYIQMLEQLTHAATFPYGGTSRLGQLRTNDQLFGQGWDLREFSFDGEKLAMRAVDQTADPSLNSSSSSELVEWINSHASEVLAGSFKLPPKFRTASAFMMDDRFEWFADNPLLDPQLASKFSEASCNGCHGKTTETSFFHIFPREDQKESEISEYLKQQLPVRAEALRTKVCP